MDYWKILGQLGFLMGNIKLNTVHRSSGNEEIHTLKLLREKSGEYLYLILTLKI